MIDQAEPGGAEAALRAVDAAPGGGVLDPVRMKEAIESAVKMLRNSNNFTDEYATESRLLIATELEEAVDGTYAFIEEVICDRDGPR